jgi:hypothetical protein
MTLAVRTKSPVLSFCVRGCSRGTSLWSRHSIDKCPSGTSSHILRMPLAASNSDAAMMACANHKALSCNYGSGQVASNELNYRKAFVKQGKECASEDREKLMRDSLRSLLRQEGGPCQEPYKIPTLSNFPCMMPR